MVSWAMDREEVEKPCGLGRDSQSQWCSQSPAVVSGSAWSGFFPVLDPQIQEGLAQGFQDGRGLGGEAEGCRLVGDKEGSG